LQYWDEIRLKARHFRQIVIEHSGGDASAEALLNSAESLTNIPREGVPTDDPLLFGAYAVLRLRVIWYDRGRERWQQLFDQLHEYAHFWLGDEECICGESDLNWETLEESVPLGAARVAGYGPHERRELTANLFARELLLPSDSLREQFMAGKSAEQIATEVGMPTPMVFHQLTRALLGPEVKEPEAAVERPNSNDLELDPSQREAAFASGPVLVDAGPGTGKTRTLVGRAAYLLSQPSTKSSQILALTFSNKAAEEMYARVISAVSSDASEMWVGTFHAFGLELVHKYYDRLKISAKPKIIDPLEARLLLEQSLGSLDLNYYRSLRNPSANIPAMLDAISRAKDELVGPRLYSRLATKEFRNAPVGSKGEAQREKALRALEVAHVYARYQALLKQNDYLDYGDLLFLAGRLLKRNRGVRDALRERFKYVLVDEYQDVNTASRLLLRHLVEPDGHGLWVVGDLRQAIYRFFGAAPTNMKRLTTKDYPHARTIQLKVNYRSQAPIVRTFESCASRMITTRGRHAEAWEVARTEQNTEAIRYKEVGTQDLEAEAIAEQIKEDSERAIPDDRGRLVSYRNQAVLCRTHKALARVSAVLERKGIPVLYFGNFLERPEICDMLSLIELAAEADGRALHRVARLPEYGISHKDFQALITWAHKHQVYFPEALSRAAEVEGISADGLLKFTLLADHYSDFTYGTNTWNLIANYLFVKSDYLRELIRQESVQALQKRLAIYQFMQLAYALRDRFVGQQNDQKRLFLDYVRRLRTTGEEKSLRQTPAWADDIDAVRMLTIHASKGLEFSVVHIANLSQSQFPRPDRGDKDVPCPPPMGMLSDEMVGWHEEEEQCLFFVALSRARDALRLYRALRYGKDRYDRRESPLMLLLGGKRPTAERLQPAILPHEPAANIVLPVLVKPRLTERETVDYLRCSLEYHYRYDLNIRDTRRDTPYGQAYLCVNAVWRRVENILDAGESIDRELVTRLLAEVWEDGPIGHPYEAYYRRDAELMVHRPLEYLPGAKAHMLRPQLRISLDEGEIIVRPDYLEEITQGDKKLVIAQRFRIGPPQQASPKDKFRYDLYDLALEEVYPEATRLIQVIYMSMGDPIPVEINYEAREKSLRLCRRALQGVAMKMFRARPNVDHCPHCPGCFICPSAEQLHTSMSL
jgi:DNA helicase-2/ATP-dependent DNA helicase PcrA